MMRKAISAPVLKYCGSGELASDSMKRLTRCSAHPSDGAAKPRMIAITTNSRAAIDRNIAPARLQTMGATPLSDAALFKSRLTDRSEEQPSELQSLMRHSYAVF